MARTAVLLMVTVTAAFWCTQELHAQYGGGGGGGMGGGGGAGAGGGSSGFGASSGAFSSSNSAFSSAGTGSGSFATAGFGSGFSTSGFSGSSGSTGAGAVGIGGAQSMYGLRAAGSGTTTTGFGGNSYSGYQSSYSGRGSTTGYGGASSRGRRGTNPQQNPGEAGAAAPVWFEPRVEVGFPVSLPQNTAVAGGLVNSFHSPVLASRFGSVQVKVEGNTAVLRGSVASVGDRDLAAQMALLEPSIYSIRNELTVGPPVPAAKPPAQ